MSRVLCCNAAMLLGLVGCVQGDLVMLKLPGPDSSKPPQKVESKPVETQPGEDSDGSEGLPFWFE